MRKQKEETTEKTVKEIKKKTDENGEHIPTGNRKDD